MKHTGKALLLLVSLVSCSVLETFSQISPQGLTPEMLLPQLSNLTPEAASLGKYGAFQVSEYSGAANISIPLYTVKSGDISFPINLYYEATGIKVEQDATFVGLGWNLSYGGMISHIICGEDDFREVIDYRDFHQNWWKYKINELKTRMPIDLPFFYELRDTILDYVDPTKDPTNAGSYSNGFFSKNSDERVELYNNMAKGYDTPDVYQASFCGHNLSFVIDKRTGKNADGLYPVVILNNDSRKYKISYDLGGTTQESEYPDSFIITDDKGISYYFKGYCENYRWATKNSGIDSYYLTKIYGVDGQNGKSVVTIEYEQKSISYGGGRYRSRPMSKFHKPTSERLENRTDSHTEKAEAFRNPPSYSVEIACSENGICYKVYPKRIITALDTIEFNKGSREDIESADCISGITIKSKDNGSKRNINFSYDYFMEESPCEWYTGKRLKLTGLAIDDQKYQFEYDDKKLPAFTSYSKDYWGYYNGANPNATCYEACTPAYTISDNLVHPEKHLDGSNRLASETRCNVGMLKRIVYPTGGYTDYEFEANRFNDKYYYPDASDCNISLPPSIINITDCSMYVSASSRSNTKTFTASQKDYKLKIEALLYDFYDQVEITIRKSSDSRGSTFYRNGPSMQDGWSAWEYLSLDAGETYTVETKLTSVKNPSAFVYCTISYDTTNTNVTALPKTKNEKGGYSIGGGLRVKTIKNYDADNKYLNGVEYEYEGGKLLSPTPHLEMHYVDYDDGPINNPNEHVRFSFYYANTEPTYLYICSHGIPAVVGYESVIKNEIDKNGNVLRKTVSDFFNYGYVADDCAANQISSCVQSAFYFNSYYSKNLSRPQGHLNGMIKKVSIYKGDVLASKTQYEYDFIKQDTIYYQKCIPIFLPKYAWLPCLRYDLAFFRKFITWSYLTKKDETFYDANGNKTTSRVTTYSYDDSNYQVSQQIVSDGQNTESVRYWYPLNSENQSTGLSHLINKNCLSEVTGVETYRNGFFTGGSKFNYTTNNIGIPVVEACYSILPNRECIQQMKVTGYDNYGNIREYEKKDGTPVTILWSYSHQYPVMEIVGKRYDDIKSDDVDKMEDPQVIPMPTEARIRSVYNTIRNKYPDAHVTAYIYTPWHTISSIITPNGYETHYGYDDFGRLKEASDFTGILQKYQYNYKIK